MSMLTQILNGESSQRCYVIAEAGLNHNGSVEIAKRLIDVAAVAGADAVKFQKRTVQTLAVQSVLDAPDDRFPEFGRTYREIREHLEFTSDEYRVLQDHAASHGIDFMVTAFDTDAVDFLEKLGVGAYKVASHSLTNIELLGYIARLRKPTILSTGMAELDEMDLAVETFRRHGTPLAVLHCVSAYPTPLDQCNLAMLDVLRRRYGIAVGYSGHEMGFLATLVAVAMGATIVERHFTLDRTMTGFDHKLSLEPDELIAMVRDIHNIAKVRGTGEKRVSESEMLTRRKYHVSMASSTPIRAGETLAPEMVVYRNPGTGVPPKLAHTLLGRRAARDISADELLSSEMFE